jgi:hypothetical protein
MLMILKAPLPSVHVGVTYFEKFMLFIAESISQIASI